MIPRYTHNVKVAKIAHDFKKVAAQTLSFVIRRPFLTVK